MGGEDEREWFLHPERPAVIIGTQDMLLSRALNRGYATSRARWPMEFGLLSQDALWVMDEVQLMDVGLATSAQLQAFRDEDQSKHLRPCNTWWMSATLRPGWLRTVDTAPRYEDWVASTLELPAQDQSGGIWNTNKELELASISATDHRIFSQRILDLHARHHLTAEGRVTLVVCNTVERACRTFDALREAGRTNNIELVHSRFRPAERETWADRFLTRDACSGDVDRIVVATQVVEAGVDLSAACLVTELAPWPSLVQRFGRCARFGGLGQVLVVDRGQDDKSALPYKSNELAAAWDTLQQLDDVGIKSLEQHDQTLSEASRQRLFPYAPEHILLRSEYEELFDTTPDLTGADLDISRFIRGGEDRDLLVFWSDIEDNESPPPERRPHRRELCPVPFLKARDWLCGEETSSSKKPKLRSGMRAWVWDWLEGRWMEASRATMLPGRVICVDSRCGGYELNRGFVAESKVRVPQVPQKRTPDEVDAMNEADDQQSGEHLSYSPWKTIATHSQEVAALASALACEVGLPEHLRQLLELAARWHDWGKAHPAFQGSIRTQEGSDRIERPDIAKAPTANWPKRHRYQFADDSDLRPGFRHELASTLGLFCLLQRYAPQHPSLLGPWLGVLPELSGFTPLSGEQEQPPTPLAEKLINCTASEFDLVAYLVAGHHGKVRVGLHASPNDQEYRDTDGRGLPIRGVREGDQLPSILLAPDEPPMPEIELTLSPAYLGLSCRTGISWRERCISLIELHGPASLAFLEAILRAADVRASRMKTNDPMLVAEAKQ
jgi:CRISPR-associated endonuclease/helicase Cas3